MFAPSERPRATGVWSGAARFATALGPLVGGLLIAASWRWIFLVNVPLALVTLAVTRRWVPATRDADATGRVDVAGAALAVGALAGVTYGLIEYRRLPRRPGRRGAR